MLHSTGECRLARMGKFSIAGIAWRSLMLIQFCSLTGSNRP